MALNELCDGDTLANLVKQSVYDTLYESFNQWSIRDFIRNNLDSKLKDYLNDKCKEFAEHILNNNTIKL